MKLFEFYINNGDWGGYRTFYTIANSKEEAIEKTPEYQDDIDLGYDHHIREMTGEDLFKMLLTIQYDKYSQKYTFNYTITEKVE